MTIFENFYTNRIEKSNKVTDVRYVESLDDFERHKLMYTRNKGESGVYFDETGETYREMN